MNFQPRNYQIKAVQAIITFLKSGDKGNPLVVAPTGSGKSIIIALFCEAAFKNRSNVKVLIISHIKEILSQNYKALQNFTSIENIGLYSAGLKKKMVRNFTIGGIQSMYNQPELFEQFDYIIVDEAHTIPHHKKGRYFQFFKHVKKIVIGFTATPFRMGTGHLHKGADAFFSKIIYDIPIHFLQKQNFLCQLSTKGTEEKLNPKNIKKQAGDYIVKDLSLAFDRIEITKRIISELVKYKTLREHWLVFAIDIKHANHITEELNAAGIKSACVHSKMPDRDKTITAFKNNKFQALISVAMLTTGFDVPQVDLIALLRPTASPVLHVQIIGRGLRIAEKKHNCLILDFAGNLIRNGSIDDPVIETKITGNGDPIMKECPKCFEIVHAAVRVCPECKEKFLFQHNLTAQPQAVNAITVKEWHNVDDVKYLNYIGTKKIPMLLVVYKCGLRVFKEYVCFEHKGYAKQRAAYWWKRRTSEGVPFSVYNALKIINSKKLREPVQILVKEKKDFPQIMEQKWEVV
jgi:DNA repair protein RadD